MKKLSLYILSVSEIVKSLLYIFAYIKVINLVLEIKL